MAFCAAHLCAAVWVEGGAAVWLGGGAAAWLGGGAAAWVCAGGGAEVAGAAASGGWGVGAAATGGGGGGGAGSAGGACTPATKLQPVSSVTASCSRAIRDARGADRALRLAASRRLASRRCTVRGATGLARVCRESSPVPGRNPAGTETWTRCRRAAPCRICRSRRNTHPRRRSNRTGASRHNTEAKEPV